VGVAAGLTQGSLYNYIRPKDDVFYLVCAELTARYSEQVMDAITSIDDPPLRLRVAVEALVRCMHANRWDKVGLSREPRAATGLP
jgi:AcrR family transcriptional regulator